MPEAFMVGAFIGGTILIAASLIGNQIRLLSMHVSALRREIERLRQMKNSSVGG